MLCRKSVVGAAAGSRSRTRSRRASPAVASLRNGAGLSAAAALEASLNAAPQPVKQQAGRPAFPQLIPAVGRSPDEVAAAVAAQLEQYPQALVTSVEPDMYAAVRKLVSGVQYHARAKMLICKPQDSTAPKQRKLPGTVCVLSAGPEDQAAADQVKLAAEHLGCYVLAKSNLSILDMQQLNAQMPAIQAADVVVVIAGADNALPSVVAGLVEAPVIAVPTSTGPNAGLQALANLVAAVGSCAPGVSVVNIDGTASAAVMAARVLHTAAARVERLVAAQQAAAAAAASAPAQAPAAVPAFVLGSMAANNVVPTFDALSLPTGAAV